MTTIIASAPAAMNVIVDVDMGTNDAWALLFLLFAEKLGVLRILGLMTTAGNTSQDNVVRNTARILNLLDVSHIPIYRGIDGPLYTPINPKHYHFHGVDGMGDLELEGEPDFGMLVNTSGIVGIRDLIMSKPEKDVTLITLGPLTNTALLLKTFKEIKLKELIVMGGNYKGIGNITPSGEFNFYFDPEAARITFETFTGPITILPWETCVKFESLLAWRLSVKPIRENKVYDMLNLAEEKIHAAVNRTTWRGCDAQLAAVYAFRDRLHPVTVPAKLWVETEGMYTRGQAVVKLLDGSTEDVDDKANVNIVTKFDEVEFRTLLEVVVTGL